MRACEKSEKETSTWSCASSTSRRMSSHAASRAVTRVSNSLLARTPRKKRNAKRLATNRLRHDDLELPKVLLETPGLLGVFKPASYAIQGGEHRANAEKWHMFVSGALSLARLPFALRRDQFAALQAEYGTVYAVDRLEAGTSGALLFARNAGQSRRLQRLAEKKGGLYKTFLALTYGDLTSSEAWAKAPPVMMSDGSMGRKVVGHFRKDEDQTRRCRASQHLAYSCIFVEQCPAAADVAGEELVTHISIVETSVRRSSWPSRLVERTAQSDERFRLLRLEPQSLVRHGLRAQLAIQLKGTARSPLAKAYCS